MLHTDMPLALQSRVTVSDTGCWLWEGALSKGYGHGWADGAQVSVHVAVYGALVGPVPEGLELDHTCKVKRCCNPGHLEPVTHRENVLRGCSPVALNAAKVVCLHGHPLEGDNLYVRLNGQRQCKTCKRATKLRWRENHKKAA